MKIIPCPIDKDLTLIYSVNRISMVARARVIAAYLGAKKFVLAMDQGLRLAVAVMIF